MRAIFYCKATIKPPRHVAAQVLSFLSRVCQVFGLSRRHSCAVPALGRERGFFPRSERNIKNCVWRVRFPLNLSYRYIGPLLSWRVFCLYIICLYRVVKFALGSFVMRFPLVHVVLRCLLLDCHIKYYYLIAKSKRLFSFPTR